MKELFDLLKSLDATASAKTLELIQKMLYGICGQKYEGVVYFFLILKQ